ncbi:MAG: U32 family peptidase [Candidatus Dormibacteria bacterium]
MDRQQPGKPKPEINEVSLGSGAAAGRGEAASDILGQLGLAGDIGCPTSEKRFPDGAQYRVEIPSTEGPACLELALEEIDRLDVCVHRFSQGSGVLMMTDAELDRMAHLASEARVEVSLFARPAAGWGASAMSRSSAGVVASASAFGVSQLRQVLGDTQRAAAHGFRSVLIGDIGALALVDQMRKLAILPSDFQVKTSVLMPVTNPATARVLEHLGASTINVATDLTLEQLAAIRAAVAVPLDMYVESPSSLGGMVRLHEIPEIIRVAAPVYIKYGISGAPDIYPAGVHVQSLALALTRERVRRARLGAEILMRSGSNYTTSELGAQGLAVPTPVVATGG